jgi:hypothetical protein
MKPTVLCTEGQRRENLKLALVAEHSKPKRTAAYYPVKLRDAEIL